MCRMTGVVFRQDFPMVALTDLKDVAKDGKIPGEAAPGHNDGWGIVSFRNGSPFYVGRSSRPIWVDDSYRAALCDAAKIRGPSILIAHARALSKGVASIPNTHPFVIGGIAMCHNGTVKNIDFKPRHPVKGETDSEMLLARLADRAEDSGDIEMSIRDLITQDVHSREYTAAIMFISDGTNLFAYRDYSPGKSPEYYDLKMSVYPDSVVFFQETRTECEGEVSQIENGELVTVDLDLRVRREMIR